MLVSWMTVSNALSVSTLLGIYESCRSTMLHHASADFWKDYDHLPRDVRRRADKQFALLKSNALHPSLHFKKIGDRAGQEIWSARISLSYRALALRVEDGFVWFWIGEHGEYDQRIE
jgi:hypothetical protein